MANLNNIILVYQLLTSSLSPTVDFCYLHCCPCGLLLNAVLPKTTYPVNYSFLTTLRHDTFFLCIFGKILWCIWVFLGKVMQNIFPPNYFLCHVTNAILLIGPIQVESENISLRKTIIKTIEWYDVDIVAEKYVEKMLD